MLKIILLGLIITTKAQANFLNWIVNLERACPKVSLKTPKCPKGSSRILDDTYPIKALIISNRLL